MQKYLRPVLIFLFLPIFNFSSISYAQTSGQYLDTIYKLIDQKQYDDAIALVKKASSEYPQEMGFAVAAGEIYQLKGHYLTAIRNYLNIIETVATDDNKGEIAGWMHEHLIDAYNGLGMEHYFSKELCLRIIYHTEKSFELDPKILQDKKYIEFLRKSVGHYDMAKMGPNVKMIETGGDGADFQLPDDYVSADEKMRYKDKAVQRIKEYDAAGKGNPIKSTISDKTVEDMIQMIDRYQAKIRSIHAKQVNIDGKVSEEFFYKSPDKIKDIQPDAISIIVNGQYYVIDPKDNRIADQSAMDTPTVSLLKAIGFYNLREVKGDYNLSVSKIAGCPDMLGEVCKSSTLDLYLITGKLKNENGGPYPPTPKIEYWIDGNTGLCLVKREYWLGVLGSGQEEQLAKEIVISRIQKAAQGIYLPAKGKTRGYVQELTGINEDWELQVISVNAGVDDKEFVVSASPKPKRPLVQTAISTYMFSTLGLDAVGLLNDLLKNGYIDGNGLLTDKFFELNDYSGMTLGPPYEAKKKQIYDILKKFV